MSNRHIELIEIDGKTIWVEVSEVEATEPPKPQHPSDLRRGAEPTSATSTLVGKVTSVRDTLEAVISSVSSGMKAAAPDEWSVEVNLGFDGKTKVPFVAEGGINGGIKVTATWKKG